MVDVTRILASPDIVRLREATAAAFEDLSVELTNSEKIADLEARVSVVEAKP
jgi:hypothetical protein